MPAIPCAIIDAFTDQLFSGNPAAVCRLDSWLPDDILQNIAKEFNLSETAFVVQTGDDFDLRWFTPSVEVDLCGHATLAAARFLKDEDPHLETIRFSTRSGSLGAHFENDFVYLDFPLQPGKPVSATPDWIEHFGPILFAEQNEENLHLVLEKEEQVKQYRFNEAFISNIGNQGVILSSLGEKDSIDFVSRYFAPNAGVPEDPVTGSAHCLSAIYYAQTLKTNQLQAFQCSSRGGLLKLEINGDRISIGGMTQKFMNGTIQI